MKRKITTEAFDEILGEILDDMKASTLLAIPGIYEILAEEYNNEVLERWEDEWRRDEEYEEHICQKLQSNS